MYRRYINEVVPNLKLTVRHVTQYHIHATQHNTTQHNGLKIEENNNN